MVLKKGEGDNGKDIAEFHSLHTVLINLHEKFLRRKQELRLILEETAAKRREALLTLEKANRLTRHLTGGQRLRTGLTYNAADLKARIKQINPVIFRGIDEEAPLPEFQVSSQRELKKTGLIILALIDNVKKKLFQLDILEMRLRELILSINKALEAFRHEWKIIRRKIYPFGFISLCYRSLRRFLGQSYFSPGDMDDVSALGRITGHVLKIADSSAAAGLT